MAFTPTIGLEVHAELKTRTKMFCDSKNDPDEVRANANVCPVCLAHPGTLPVINREAVRHILRIGTAVGGTLADFAEFDRKSYFYPDIPKGYQISQYEHPLVRDGSLAGVKLTRIHLEEDTARSSHSAHASLVDFNRAGVPLMELVTEPVIHDAETAGRFARELQLLLRTLGAGAANLEKGEMRIEANVSVSKDDTKFGTKVEIKNLNSFRSVERAIAFEIKRQSELIESGGAVVQETRGWDENKQQTFHQRFKEGSADYRYFPEPDLPKLLRSEIPELSDETLKRSLPKLPWEVRAEYAALGLKVPDIETILESPQKTAFFSAVVGQTASPTTSVLASNFFLTDLAGEPGRVTPEALAKLAQMFEKGDLTSRGAKDTLRIVAEEGGDPEDVAKARGFMQVSDPATLRSLVEKVIATEEKAVTEYKAGKEASLQYLLGKAIKESRGSGNPEIIRQILQEKLSE